MRAMNDSRGFDHPKYYINRELSWLAFDQRVLEEAMDESNPLLERLNFAVIANSNMDEFFMVRVAGWVKQWRRGSEERDAKSGMTPRELLQAISVRSHLLMARMEEVVHDHLVPALKNEGILFPTVDDLSNDQRDYLRAYFAKWMAPFIERISLHSNSPSTLLLNGQLYVAALLKGNSADEEILVFSVPFDQPRCIQIPSGDEQTSFVFCEDLLRWRISELVDRQVTETVPFRVIRSFHFDLDVERPEDLLRTMERQLERQNLGAPVRLDLLRSVRGGVRGVLQSFLGLDDEDVYEVTHTVDLTAYGEIVHVPGYAHLRYALIPPATPEWFSGAENMFTVIARRDVLVHHPYESFEPVVRFVEDAANDPLVTTIRQTLYRVSGDSPIIHALAQASKLGKSVTVLVEIKARFDEENNIGWAKMLEQAGCRVIYGLPHLKVHGKMIVVERQEDQGVRRYVHLATGNYNDVTARLYTDIGLFTADPQFGDDAALFFQWLSGEARSPSWKRLITAPTDLRDTCLALIEREMMHVREGREGRIIAKMNALTDKPIMEALYRASCAGVSIQLIVRGICCLRPGLEGVSDRIHVRSIVGRLLEHSRIYSFHNGGDPEVYLASADWMTRNMERRVETMFPILRADLREELHTVLGLLLRDQVNAHRLLPDGSYEKIKMSDEPVDSQMKLYAWAESQS